MRISDCSSDVCSSDLAGHQCEHLRDSDPGGLPPAQVLDAGDMSVFCFVETLDHQEHNSAGYEGCGHHRHREQRLDRVAKQEANRSEEHTSELQSLMRISYAVFCLKKKIKKKQIQL